MDITDHFYGHMSFYVHGYLFAVRVCLALLTNFFSQFADELESCLAFELSAELSGKVVDIAGTDLVLQHLLRALLPVSTLFSVPSWSIARSSQPVCRPQAVSILSHLFAHVF
jgi:hypothetical protein